MVVAASRLGASLQLVLDASQDRMNRGLLQMPNYCGTNPASLHYTDENKEFHIPGK